MTDLVKVQAATAAELLQFLEITEEAEHLLVPDTAPEVSINRLADAGFYPDAIKLLALGLPKRESVWWACLCAKDSQNAQTDELNRNALAATEGWVRTPSEERRQLCRQLGEQTRHKTAASWAATAAAWSHGSLSAPGEPAIEPPAHLYAHAVAGSVTLAAVHTDPISPEKLLAQFLQRGLDLARGGTGKSA
ncbi:DUF6931 family protein [Microbulbifer mangrovi]|uniref:DUF6931 family protein n=1 Tax=Microbulbifer mangrovi TaxID=927787 RepID=UPI0009903CE7|nr:hypothetical protein [Microbulbifer mangrovi]